MRQCEHCGYDYSGEGKRFCSHSCANKVIGAERRLLARTCPVCGQEFVPATGRRQTCGRSCGARLSYWPGHRGVRRRSNRAYARGAEHRFWKGGRVIDKKGYIRIWKPDHPRASKQSYVMEHRLVMEQTLGRYLEPWENVHHINGIKGDNRPQNLELWASKQPAYQRVGDPPHCETCRCG